MIVIKIPDSLDQQLISYLREDGRQSSRALAARLGITSVAVGRRILKLISGGTIRVTVFVDPRRVGAPLGIIIGLQVAQAQLATAARTLAAQPSTLRVAVTTGRFNLITVSFFSSVEELSEYARLALLNMPGVMDADLFILLQSEKPDSAAPKSLPLDDTDLGLVRELRRDGRATAVELARLLRISPITAQRRMRRLTDGGQIRIVTLINLKHAPWHWQAAVALRARRDLVSTVLRKLIAHPAVDFASCTSGRYNLFASVSAESHEKLRSIVEEEFARWEGVAYFELFVAESVTFGPLWAG